MSRFANEQEEQHYNGNGLTVDAESIDVQCTPADKFGKRFVELRLYGSSYRDEFNTNDHFRLTKFAERTGADGPGIECLREAVLKSADDVDSQTTSIRTIEKFTFGTMTEKFPQLHAPVVEGLGREGEVANIVSTSKAGKSWLLHYILLCIVTGRYIFGRFATSRGPILLIDNELHKPTLVHRVSTVANAMGLQLSDFADEFHIWPLRGNLRPFADLAFELEQAPDKYKAIGWDARYRFQAEGENENDNSPAFYNLADRIAVSTSTLQFFVHHSTKGSQSEKRVTDVGAGGGVQSRAADTHLVLREHEEPGVVVLEAAVRSFAPVEPLALRWSFPLWIPADDVDTSLLKGRLKPSEERQNEKDREGVDKIVHVLRKWSEADGPATPRALREKTGIGPARQQRLLDSMVSDGLLVSKSMNVRGNPTREYSFPEDDK